MTKKDITYQDKLNELMLDISHPNNHGQAFILVEGESDIRLFRKFFNLSKCNVECIPGGNPKLEECVEDLIKISSLVIGIRDSDFIHLASTPYSNQNMFLTDYHDIEMTLISENDVFSALVFEFTEIPEVDHLSVRNKIINIIEQLSFLKWLNQLNNLELKFGCGFQDLISFDNLEIDFPKYFSRVLSKSPNAKITDILSILSEIQILEITNPNPFQLCNGHDFIKTFSQFVKERGTVKACSPDFVSSAFRMIYRNDYFSKTVLNSDIKNWAAINHCSIYAEI